MQTIQLTAQVDDRGVLRVQMPDGLKNSTVEATIVFTSLENSVAVDRIAWAEFVGSLAGAWAEDFPSLTEIQTEASELSEIVKQMGINQNTMVDVTIETTKDDFLAIMDLIGKEAQANGLTEEILEELLTDES